MRPRLRNRDGGNERPGALEERGPITRRPCFAVFRKEVLNWVPPVSKGSLAWCAGFGIRGEWWLETANQPIASCQRGIRLARMARGSRG